jgi:hypothetical protein
MKNKILVVGVFVFIFILATNMYAIAQNGDTGMGNQMQQRIQIDNQSENDQIQTQNREQVQLEMNVEMGNQVQQQNQVQNQGETSQLQNSEQQQTQTQKNLSLNEQRRSQVANAVQEMLQVAERDSEMGQQIRIIAQNQNQNQEKIEDSLQKVQSRSGFVKLFIGQNYAEINNIKKMLMQNKEQIEQLNQIKNQLVNQDDQQQLNEQVQVLEQTNLQVGSSLEAAQKGFSLFGWMFRMFAK